MRKGVVVIPLLAFLLSCVAKDEKLDIDFTFSTNEWHDSTSIAVQDTLIEEVKQKRHLHKIKTSLKMIKLADSLYIPEVDGEFEFLNIEEFLPGAEGKKYYSEENEDFLLTVSEHNDLYQVNIYPKQSCFFISKSFYKSGIIREKGLFFYFAFQKGKWYFFDEKGNLTETIDNDKPYKFTFEDLYKFLKQKNIPVGRGIYKNNSKAAIHKHVRNDGVPTWIVSWQKNPLLIGEITLDGNTGKVLEERDMRVEY